jgi:thiol-disulfide isomerase/thioredoxin
VDQDASERRTRLTRANQLLRATTHPAAVQLPVEGSLPSLAGATGWLNPPPLTAAGLRGRVVLVDFWTYTCINWLRTLAYLRAWADNYRDHGLVVTGVHTLSSTSSTTPTTSAKPPPTCGLGIRSRSATTTPSGARSTTTTGRRPTSSTPRAGSAPSLRRGRPRTVRAGPAAGCWPPPAGGIGQDLVPVDPGGVEAAADRDSLWSRRPTWATRAARTSPRPTVRSWIPLRAMPPPRGWSSTIGPCPGTGRWPARPPCCTRPTGGSPTASTPATCTWSWHRPRQGSPCGCGWVSTGGPRGAAHGTDVDDQGNGTVTQPRLYQLVRQPGPVSDRTFEVTFLDPGVQASAFTFG